MTEGELIRQARKKAHITQEELGTKLGVSGSMIAQYETGKRKPKYDTIKRIASVLGVDWVSLTPEDDASIAHLIWDELRENLKKSGTAKKVVMSDAALYRAGILQFHSEKDRIAHFYKKLTDDGKIASGVCFYQHLNKESLTEVADYVMGLSENPLYQAPSVLPDGTPGNDTTPTPPPPESTENGE